MPGYFPNDAEIDDVIRPAIRRRPDLRDALLEAADILRAGAMSLLERNYSAAEPPVYRHRATFVTCTCDEGQRAAEEGRAPDCPHRLAVLAYRAILLRHLRYLLLGDAADPAVCAEARRSANAVLLLGREQGRIQALAYWTPVSEQPHKVCALVETPQGVTFANEAALEAFAVWLNEAGWPRPALEAQLVYRAMTARGVSPDKALTAAGRVLRRAGIAALEQAA